MSYTPRTDALRLRFTKGNADLDALLGLCDMLERELNEAKDLISTLEDEIAQIREANLELTTTLNNIARK